jgi:peptide/nickel transport system permease protein
MLRYIARRLIGMVVLLLVISFVTFQLFFAVPLDPAALTCGKACTPDVVAANRKKMGLDKPNLVQYGNFIKGIVAGRTYGEGTQTVACDAPCLGFSFREERPVRSMLVERVPITLSLSVGAFVIWLVVGVSIGIVSALKRGSLVDRSLMFLALAAVSLPSFFTGLMVLFFLVIKWGIFDFPTYVAFTDNPFLWAKNLFLPWVVLALLFAALYTRLTRANMIETMSEDYIRTARAKGLSERKVIFKHGLRAALTPIITIAGLDLGTLLGGATITETVFNFQGLGRLTLSAATEYDLPVLVGVTIVAAFFIVLANLIVDLLYAVVDPKVRLA